MDQLRADDPAHTALAPAPEGVPVRPAPSDGSPEAFELESLRRKLESLPVIEQAKGMLMGCYGVDAEQAFALLRRWSSARHVKLRDLCREVVERGATRGSEPYAGLRGLLDETGLSVRPPD